MQSSWKTGLTHISSSAGSDNGLLSGEKKKIASRNEVMDMRLKSLNDHKWLGMIADWKIIDTQSWGGIDLFPIKQDKTLTAPLSCPKLKQEVIVKIMAIYDKLFIKKMEK